MMPDRSKFILFCSVMISLTAVSATSSPAHQPKGYEALFEAKEGRLPASATQSILEDLSGYDALHYDIEIKFFFESKFVDGHVDMLFAATEDQLSQINMHLNSSMSIDAIEVDGQTSGYQQVPISELIIQLPEVLNKDDSATVSIDYSGYPLENNLEGLFWDYHEEIPVVSSLSEPEGTRSWWPCKDVPSDKTTARMVWTVPDWMTATGNGLLESVTQPEPGWLSYEWIENYPIAPYLIAVTASDFAYWQDWYVTATNDSLPLDYYIYPEDSLFSTIDFVDVPSMIACFASLFGEYPFMEEKYGHVEFNFGGAMEHQTLTSLGNPWINGEGPEQKNWIYAHELAHMWWGDLVTCDTWKDIWLNEGFATYCDALWHYQDKGETGFRGRMIDFRSAYLEYEVPEGEGRFPIYDPREMWGTTVYQKGAWILHMLRYIVGEENFWNFFSEYRSRYEFGSVNTAQLQETLEDVSGMNLDWFFDQWVYQAGYPEYEWGWQSTQLGDSSLVDLSINQVQSTEDQTPACFVMPIEIKVYTISGSTFHTVQNDQRKHQNFSFMVEGVPHSLRFDTDNWILKTAVESLFVGVDEATTQPEDFQLKLSVRPNPANPTAQISFTLPQQQQVKLAIYDLMGRKIATLFEGVQPLGENSIVWNASEQASGIYLIRLETPDKQLTKKLAILK